MTAARIKGQVSANRTYLCFVAPGLRERLEHVLLAHNV